MWADWCNPITGFPSVRKSGPRTAFVSGLALRHAFFKYMPRGSEVAAGLLRRGLLP
jgi:hypothetical protein